MLNGKVKVQMSNRTAIIVSDDRRSLRDLEEILGASDHDLVVINNALLAVDTVVRNKPGVVLLELRMPRKNGFEIADEINYALESKKMPIIAMSSVYRKEFGFLFNLCGINGHLKKPFRPLDVMWAIENVTKEAIV